MKLLFKKEYESLIDELDYYKNKYNILAKNKWLYLDEIEKLNNINFIICNDLQRTLEVNNRIKIGDNELVEIDVDHIKYLINISKEGKLNNESK